MSFILSAECLAPYISHQLYHGGTITIGTPLEPSASLCQAGPSSDLFPREIVAAPRPLLLRVAFYIQAAKPPICGLWEAAWGLRKTVCYNPDEPDESQSICMGRRHDSTTLYNLTPRPPHWSGWVYNRESSSAFLALRWEEIHPLIVDDLCPNFGNIAALSQAHLRPGLRGKIRPFAQG